MSVVERASHSGWVADKLQRLQGGHAFFAERRHCFLVRVESVEIRLGQVRLSLQVVRRTFLWEERWLE